jgi:hypothetical protein
MKKGLHFCARIGYALFNGDVLLIQIKRKKISQLNARMEGMSVTKEYPNFLSGIRKNYWCHLIEHSSFYEKLTSLLACTLRNKKVPFFH